jgi:four helix bundle protein
LRRDKGEDLAGSFYSFLEFARGSVFEVQTQLLIARRLGYVGEELIVGCEGLGDEVGKMLNALIASLNI